MSDKLAHEEKRLRAAVMLDSDELKEILSLFNYFEAYPKAAKDSDSELSKVYLKLKKTLKYLEAME